MGDGMGQAEDSIKARGWGWLLAGALLAAGLPAVAGCHRRAAPSQDPRTSERKSSLGGEVSPRVSVVTPGPQPGNALAGNPAEVRAVSGAAAEPPGRAATWGAATDLLVYVTLDVPGRLPVGSVLRVDLADASDITGPVRSLATRELSVSHGDRLQVSIAVPTEVLRAASRLALSARVEGRRGRDLLAITTVPLILGPEQLDSRLELWVRALPSYEPDPKFEPWLLSPEEMRRANDVRSRGEAEGARDEVGDRPE